jgi:hypothetical protein
LRTGPVTKVYHSKDRKTPETDREYIGEKKGFCTVRECAPFTLYTGKLTVCIGDIALNCDRGRTTDGNEECAEENGVVAHAENTKLVTKVRSGSQYRSEGRRSVRLALEKNRDNGGSGVANITKDIAVTGSVRGGGRSPNIQGQGMKRMRGSRLRV